MIFDACGVPWSLGPAGGGYRVCSEFRRFVRGVQLRWSPSVRWLVVGSVSSPRCRSLDHGVSAWETDWSPGLLGLGSVNLEPQREQ